MFVESGPVLPLGMRDESEVPPALGTSQFSGRNKLTRVTHRMCYDQSLRVWAQPMDHSSLSEGSRQAP